jgi:hypothetical protein
MRIQHETESTRAHTRMERPLDANGGRQLAWWKPWDSAEPNMWARGHLTRMSCYLLWQLARPRARETDR